jgi:ATP-dependent helicase HrpB
MDREDQLQLPQVRFDRRFSAATRLLVVTEGILTARLQTDPLLSDFRTVVLDEFHERSIHGDLAIALVRQAWRARDSSTHDHLRIVVMSATLDAAPVSVFLGGCPVIDVPGLVHPVDVSYAPAQSVANAAADVLQHPLPHRSNRPRNRDVCGPQHLGPLVEGLHEHSAR